MHSEYVGAKPTKKKQNTEILLSKVAKGTWDQLRIGMTFEEVNELIVPIRDYEVLKEMQDMIDFARGAASSGISVSNQGKVEIHGKDFDLIFTSTGELEEWSLK